MEMYLIKSGICLAILYGFYKIFLENESMHVFKRFYLLGALGISFLIPLITFTTYLEIPITTVNSTPVFVNTGATPFTEIEIAKNFWPFVLWGLYGLGVLYFSIKFGRNLKNIFSRIKNNPKLKQHTITHVLLKNPIIPHTFLNYVFLNKQKFEANEIPNEVIEHEHVHAKQKHSIDILLVELLQVVFWFNPLLYFIKRSIKLNHEFLADRAVLNRGTDAVAYQNLLLAFSSDATTPTLANSINYSFIKKRFTVMKKQTSTQAIWLRSLLVLSLLAILLYSFSSKEVIQKEVVTEQSQTEEQKQKATPAEIEEYNKLAKKYNNTPKDQLKIVKDEVIRYSLLYHKMTLEQRVNAEPFPNVEGFPSAPPVPQFTPVSNTDKDNWVKDFDDSFQQQKATPAEIEEYNKLAKKYNTMSNDNLRINAEEVKRFSLLYRKMTVEQRKIAEPFPSVEGFPSAPPVPTVPKAGQVPPVPPVPPLPHIPPRAPELMKLIEDMAENDATFYMDNKEITLEEAYKIAKSQKFNSISTTVCDNQKPILTFSKNFVPAPNDIKLAKEVLEKGGELYLNDKKINFNAFKNKLEQIRASKQDYTVNLEKGDNGKDRLRITIQE